MRMLMLLYWFYYLNWLRLIPHFFQTKLDNIRFKTTSFLLASVTSVEVAKTKSSFLEVLGKTLQNSFFCCSCNTRPLSDLIFYLYNFGSNFSFYHYFFFDLTWLGCINFTGQSKAFLLVLWLIILVAVFFLFLLGFYKNL